MSDTPIYDRLKAEFDWRNMQVRFVAPAVDFGSDWSPADGHGPIWAVPESTVSVEILPDTSRFQDMLRVGGRRAGRSAEWDRLVARVLYGASETPIYDQMCREQFNASMRETFSAVQAVLDNQARAMVQFVNGMRPYMQAVLDEEKRRQEFLAYVYGLLNPAPTRGYKTQFAILDETDPRTRALSQTNKHYPTSSPSWARKKKR